VGKDKEGAKLDQMKESMAAAQGGDIKSTPAKTPAPAKKPAATAPVPPMPTAPPKEKVTAKPVQEKAPATSTSTLPPVPPIGNVAAAISPNSHKKVEREVVVDDAFEYDVAFKFSFLGAGQAGGRLANAFYDLGYRRVSVMNTTDMDFQGLDEDIDRLSLDVGGAAKDAEFAAAQLDGREEEVWDLLTRSWGNSTEYAFICVGLGGGTGSGLTPPLIEIARKYMESNGQPPRVGAVLALPTVDEGQLIARNAINTFHTLLSMQASPLIIIDNAKVNELYRPAMSKLHSTANTSISQLFHMFNMLCEARGSIRTFDRSEFAQLLDGGVVALAAAALEEVNSPADLSTAIRDHLTQNVLAEVDLRKGKVGACLCVAHQDMLDELPVDHFAAGWNQLERVLGSSYKKSGDVTPVVHPGLIAGEHPGIQIYMMASALDPPMKRLEELAKKAGVGKESLRSNMAAFLGVDDAK